MIIGHTAIGVATGLALSNPLTAFGVGLVSHHVADYIPHFDPGSFYTGQPWRLKTAREYSRVDWLIVSADVILTMALLVFFVQHMRAEQTLAVVAGVVGANFPDLVHNVPFWNKQTRKIGWIRWWQDAIHRKYQTTVPARWWYWGVATQLVTIGLVTWYVLLAEGGR